MASDATLLSVGTTQDFGVPGGLKGDNNLTVTCGKPADNINDSSTSMPVPVLTGDYRDACSYADEDDISTDVERLAKENMVTNTTVTKSITLLNASLLNPI